MKLFSCARPHNSSTWTIHEIEVEEKPKTFKVLEKGGSGSAFGFRDYIPKDLIGRQASASGGFLGTTKNGAILAAVNYTRSTVEAMKAKLNRLENALDNAREMIG